MEGHKSELALDIMNIGNLINKDWGLIDDIGFLVDCAASSNYGGIDPAPASTSTASTVRPTARIQENIYDKGNAGSRAGRCRSSFKYKF